MAQTQRSRYLKTGAIIAKWTRHCLKVVALLDNQFCERQRARGTPTGGKMYALMIDAGSTGSRIHVYRFNNCGPTPELENEVFGSVLLRNRLHSDIHKRVQTQSCTLGILPKGAKTRAVCSYDRCWQHWVPDSCIPIQQLWPYPRT
jgi:hypothetical protein